MGKKNKKRIEPFVTTIQSIGKGGCGKGLTPDGKEVLVRFAVPETTLEVIPFQRKKDVWMARKGEVHALPQDAREPICGSFGLCGGCSLQEIPAKKQRHWKEQYGLEQVALPLGFSSIQEMAQEIQIHPILATEKEYHYRNKVELTFCNKRYLSEKEFAEGLPIEGKFLGFHASGKFDRVVPFSQCFLYSQSTQEIVTWVRENLLTEESFSVWNPREHQGFLRHIMIREGVQTQQNLIGIYTTSPANEEQKARFLEALEVLYSFSLSMGNKIIGIQWFINDEKADVAQGNCIATLGKETLLEKLNHCFFEISLPSFFQTTTEGAVVLYSLLAQILRSSSGTLLDLYCGTGSIGIFLAKQFSKIVGIEIVEEAIENAKRNAMLNELDHLEFHVGKVEDSLDKLQHAEKEIHLIVDPPRAGLHPKVAEYLSTQTFSSMLYVACNPSSLGRDAAIFAKGHWKLKQLWSVDLFPQTHHLEMVGWFEKQTPPTLE